MKIKTLVISMPKIKEILHAEKHGKMLGFSIALIQVKCPGGGSIKGGGGEAELRYTSYVGMCHPKGSGF